MEIQKIPGFKLAATTVTGSPPSPHFTRGRGGSSGNKRWRAPAEVKTLDFGTGLEPYVRPRLLPRRPNTTPGTSSRQRRGSKENCSQDKEIQFDIEHVQGQDEVSTKKDQQSVHQSCGADRDPTGAGPLLHAATAEIPGTEKREESALREFADVTYDKRTDRKLRLFPSNGHAVAICLRRNPGRRPDSRIIERRIEGASQDFFMSRVVTPKAGPRSVGSIHDGVDCKLHDVELLDDANKTSPGVPRPAPNPQQWFKRTLQQYEDLKKSVDAQISSAPSSINERVDTVADAEDSSRGACQPDRFQNGQHARNTEDQAFKLNFESSGSTARVNQLRQLRSEVTRNHSATRNDIQYPQNLRRDGKSRPLWERPEHITGKYLIHGASPILLPHTASPAQEPETLRSRPGEKRDMTGSKLLTEFSCGCSPKKVLPLQRKCRPSYSCGCLLEPVSQATSIGFTLGSSSAKFEQECHDQCPLQQLQRLDAQNAEVVVDNRAWKQLLHIVAHLREVNKGLSSTIAQLTCQEKKPLKVDFKPLSSPGSTSSRVRPIKQDTNCKFLRS